MNEFILIVMILATVIYVGWPYWQRQTLIQTGAGNGKLAELIERRDSILSQIKEIEFDCEVGTVNQDDYAELNARYRDEAVGILRQIDVFNGNNRSAHKIEKELAQLHAKKIKSGKSCSQCSSPINNKDHFCSKCGNQLNT